MAFNFNVNVNYAEVKTFTDRLGKNAPKVLADAQNRAVAGIRTDAKKLIKKESGINSKKIQDSFIIIKASAKSGSNAQAILSGRPMGLYQFPHNPKQRKKGKTKGGVKVTIGAKKLAFRHGFIAKMPNGHIGIFERVLGQKTRTGKNKLREFYGPSLPQYASRINIYYPIVKKTNERFINRFRQQSARYLNTKSK